MTVRSTLATMMLLVRAAAVILSMLPDPRVAESTELLAAIPDVATTEKRLMTLDDLLRLRDIDSLSVSADGSHFAILVRQAVPERNNYRTGWFVGSTRGGVLTFIGSGGKVRLLTFADGTTLGDIAGGPSRWSPDGKW